MKLDMVFEGGGAKGMVFVGALQALETRGFSCGRLVGTSAGAITAALLAVGYDATDLADALAERDENGEPVFAGFMDVPTADDFDEEVVAESAIMQLFKKVDIPLVPDWMEKSADEKMLKQLLKLKAFPVLFSFIENGGLYVGNAFINWMCEKLNEKGNGYADMTLSQLHNVTSMDLSLVASDTSGKHMLVLNHRTAPDCPVVMAVRMSMSIPFAWQEVVWQATWGSYQRMDAAGTAVDSAIDLTGHTIVDGGVLSNFPINLLTSDEPSVTAVMGDTKPSRASVLGMLIDESIEVPNAPPPPDDDVNDHEGVKGKIEKLRMVQRVKRLVGTMTGAHDQKLIDANVDLICRLPAKGYGTMEFDMSDERKEKLVTAGRNMMEQHLASRIQ